MLSGSHHFGSKDLDRIGTAIDTMSLTDYTVGLEINPSYMFNRTVDINKFNFSALHGYMDHFLVKEETIVLRWNGQMEFLSVMFFNFTQYRSYYFEHFERMGIQKPGIYMQEAIYNFHSKFGGVIEYKNISLDLKTAPIFPLRRPSGLVFFPMVNIIYIPIEVWNDRTRHQFPFGIISNQTQAIRLGFRTTPEQAYDVAFGFMRNSGLEPEDYDFRTFTPEEANRYFNQINNPSDATMGFLRSIRLLIIVFSLTLSFIFQSLYSPKVREELQVIKNRFGDVDLSKLHLGYTLSLVRDISLSIFIGLIVYVSKYMVINDIIFPYSLPIAYGLSLLLKLRE